VCSLLVAFILQLTIPLGGKISYGDLGVILWSIIIGLGFMMLLIISPIIRLWIKNLEFIIDEERIVIRKGIFTKIQQNIPYRAVTDFQLHRSLFDRVLNLGSIRIQTAGQSNTPTGYEGNLAGLKEWDSLLEELRGRVKKYQQGSENNRNNSIMRSEPEKLDAIISELQQIKSILEKQSG
jgi:hypothetical protein